MIKVEVIKKVRNQFCGCCNPKAKGNSELRNKCIRCDGTGKIKDYQIKME